MIRMRGLDLASLPAEPADQPFGERSSAGKLFGVTGGVMEAALRSAYFLITGNEMEDPKFAPARGLDGVKEAKVTIGDLELGIAVVSGLQNARTILEQIKSGQRDDLHFVEVMTCPGGCIAGGGQPIKTNLQSVRARMRTLYDIDRDSDLQHSHHNKAVLKLYEEELGKPLGEKSHHLLHTHYEKRDVLL